MKSAFTAGLAVACALAFALAAQAQAQAPAEHSMTGCLKKGTAENSYMLDNVEGGKIKMIGVVSSTANLAPHVTHKITVTGTAVPAAEAEKDKNVPKADHYMKLSALKMVSATCP